jgi:hypothetical protein
VYETKTIKGRTVVSSYSGSRLACLTLKIKAPTMLRNVGNHSPHDTASHRRNLGSWAAPLSQLQISHPSHLRVKRASEVIHAAVSRRKPKKPWIEGLWLEGIVPFLTTSDTFLRREGKALGAVALQQVRQWSHFTSGFTSIPSVANAEIPHSMLLALGTSCRKRRCLLWYG